MYQTNQHKSKWSSATRDPHQTKLRFRPRTHLVFRIHQATRRMPLKTPRMEQSTSLRPLRSVRTDSPRDLSCAHLEALDEEKTVEQHPEMRQSDGRYWHISFHQRLHPAITQHNKWSVSEVWTSIYHIWWFSHLKRSKVNWDHHRLGRKNRSIVETTRYAFNIKHLNLQLNSWLWLWLFLRLGVCPRIIFLTRQSHQILPSSWIRWHFFFANTTFQLIETHFLSYQTWSNDDGSNLGIDIFP